MTYKDETLSELDEDGYCILLYIIHYIMLYNLILYYIIMYYILHNYKPIITYNSFTSNFVEY